MENSHDNIDITPESKIALRRAIVNESGKLLGIPYEFGAEWTDYSKSPISLDCSELVEGVFHLVKLELPDGAQNQYNSTVFTDTPRPGDLAFFGRSKDPSKIYHVGIVYDEKNIVEARGYDPTSNFETGKVILRERVYWDRWKNFCGYRSHKKLV